MCDRRRIASNLRNGGLFGMILEFLRTGIARMPDTASEALPLLTELR